MEDYEFRGLTANNTWVYGDLTKDMPMSTSYYNEYSQRICWQEEFSQSNAPVRNKTVCRYIGLKDKYQTRIYEGDILRETYRRLDGTIHTIVRLVRWDTSLLRYELTNFMGNNSCSMTSFGDYEILGNLYENPELLVEETT